MRSTIVKRLAVVGAAGAVAAPASLAVAAEEPAKQVDLPLAGETQLVEPLEDAVENRLVHRNMRIARKIARVRGEHVERGLERRMDTWSARHLAREHRTLLRELREARRERRQAKRAAAANTTAAPHLEAIAACESGGNPSAIGGGGAYRGKYQFDYGTWASVGGSGDPAAAPEAEQDRRAAMLYAKAGATPWPVCGR